jgi:hypothetical protein
MGRVGEVRKTRLTGGADRPSLRLPPHVSRFNAERYLSLPLLQLARFLVVFVLRNSPYDTAFSEGSGTFPVL